MLGKSMVSKMPILDQAGRPAHTPAQPQPERVPERRGNRSPFLDTGRLLLVPGAMRPPTILVPKALSFLV